LPAVADPLILSLDSSQNVKVTFSSPTTLNNASTLTITGAGKLTFGGGIDGAGTVAVNTASSLTTGHIIQSSLVIGGTAGTLAVVTIAASDASGNPLTAQVAGSDAAESDNSSRLAAGSAANGSIAPVASTPFVMTTTAASSEIPAAKAPATQQTPATA